MKYIAYTLFLISCSPNINTPDLVVKGTTYVEPLSITPMIDNSCPDHMRHVSGLYCKNLKFTCLEWLDKKRCKIFSKESVCPGPEKQLNFCMDRDEASDPSGMPLTNITWNQANKMCKNWGKRLCGQDEFQQACHGPDNLPYPYGYERLPEKCNIDHKAHVKNNKLVNQTVNIKEYPECVSSYDIHNLIGNVDEWYRSDGTTLYNSVLLGGFFGYVRGNCFSKTTEHFEEYAGTQTGFRCCSSIK